MHFFIIVYYLGTVFLHTAQMHVYTNRRTCLREYIGLKLDRVDGLLPQSISKTKASRCVRPRRNVCLRTHWYKHKVQLTEIVDVAVVIN